MNVQSYFIFGFRGKIRLRLKRKKPGLLVGEDESALDWLEVACYASVIDPE